MGAAHEDCAQEGDTQVSACFQSHAYMKRPTLSLVIKFDQLF